MPSSPIRKLAPYAEKAKKNGTQIFHLNIGQPDIPTPLLFWEAIRHLDLKVLAYSPSNGYEELRNAYSRYFNERCGLHNLRPDDILITTGASEALLFTFLSILDEGDELIVPEPVYANYIGYAKSGSIHIRPISTAFEDGYALPSISAFEAAITPATKAILICNPNNPTGYAYKQEELETLRDIALRHDIFIISDEVYREFNYTGRPHVSMYDMPGLEQHVVLIDSISKRFSACGARIGMVATQNKSVLETILKFAQQRLSPPTLEQFGAIALFDVKEEYFREVHNEYRLRRDTLVQGLNSIPGVHCHIPGGAFYCMVILPVTDSDDFCRWMLESFQYNGKTVMMAPGSGFYATPGRGLQEVRVAYVLEKQALEEAVDCLRHGLVAYPGKK